MKIRREGTITIGPLGHSYIEHFDVEFDTEEMTNSAKHPTVLFREAMQDRILAAAKRITDARAEEAIAKAETDMQITNSSLN